MEKMWYIETMKYYSATKRNETGSFAVMCMDLDSVIQSEVSQKEKKKNIVYECIYVESRKMVQMNLFAGQEYKCSCRERMCGRGEETG